MRFKCFNCGSVIEIEEEGFIAENRELIQKMEVLQHERLEYTRNLEYARSEREAAEKESNLLREKTRRLLAQLFEELGIEFCNREHTID